MPFSGFFKDCFACCDADNDGKISWSEIMMSAEKVLDFLSRTTHVLSLYGPVLEAAGVDMSEANAVFDRINIVLSTTGKGVEALKNIKVSIANGTVGDVNGDGVVNKDDVKIYFKGAQDISKAIESAGISKDEMAAIQLKLQRMMDALDKLPKKTFEAVKSAAVSP